MRNMSCKMETGHSRPDYLIWMHGLNVAFLQHILSLYIQRETNRDKEGESKSEREYVANLVACLQHKELHMNTFYWCVCYRILQLCSMWEGNFSLRTILSFWCI